MRSAWTPAPLQPLPLIASSLGGEWREAGSQVELTEIRPREVVDRLPRPMSLARDPEAYALTIVGTSMSPRFRTGSRVAVSPRSPVAIGDDVSARLHAPVKAERNGTENILIMNLVRRTTTVFELRQYNPDLTVQVDAGEVDAVLKIVGELI
jgi:phage repressor protein C with HTH and peptisase S24 domain